MQVHGPECVDTSSRILVLLQAILPAEKLVVPFVTDFFWSIFDQIAIANEEKIARPFHVKWEFLSV